MKQPKILAFVMAWYNLPFTILLFFRNYVFLDISSKIVCLIC